MSRLAIRTGCLLLAVLLVAGCRSRLPLDDHATPSAVVAAAAAPAADARPPAIASFLAAGGDAERPTHDPLAPFLSEVRPDRLQDMVRMDLLTDRRRGPFAFLTTACVCVPGEDHGR